MNEEIQYKFYKRKNFKNFVLFFCLLITWSTAVYENIVRKEYIGVLLFGGLVICVIGMMSIRVISNIRRLKEPGLIINEEEIKVKLGATLKYRTIKIRDITSILVVDYDNIIQIYKEKKVIPISLYEYKKDDLEAMKEIFKGLGIQITNRSFQ
ncbi:putative membrane protein [Clostridium punense]|uniref:Membrane protein n=1 Tax=Clostridium punense TaxID=1054297 RepID=A0ABS4K654_9CLOT|nr:MULTISPECIES: hypothetical protein [Clostridium]EQB87974.1 hypothetical protein M918_06170 [Clostridium sp. BL8]MBP2023255.1 putative membrane protein [Clostridium punense]